MFPDWSVGKAGAYNALRRQVEHPCVKRDLDAVPALDNTGPLIIASGVRPTGRLVSSAAKLVRNEVRVVALQAHEMTRLVELFAGMCLVRAFEQRVSSLYRDGEIPGFVHTSLGQEAVAVGVCARAARRRLIASTHRGHGHCLAKGADVDGAMAELFGEGDRPLQGQGRLDAHRRSRATASSARTRSSARACRSPTGAALASQVLRPGPGRRRVLRRGRRQPGRVPRVAEPRRDLGAAGGPRLREQRLRGVHRQQHDDAPRERRRARRRAYGVAVGHVDGNDVEVGLRGRAGRSRRAAAAATAPSCSKRETYRWHGHYEGDRPDVQARGGGRRPGSRATRSVSRARASSAGPRDRRGARRDRAATPRSASMRAEEFARSSPFPAESEILTDVYAD